jgi:hypothetical protein
LPELFQNLYSYSALGPHLRKVPIFTTTMRRDSRFPKMPAPEDMLSRFGSPRPSNRKRNRPRNGPPIDDWEAAVIGRRIIKEDAAYTRDQGEVATSTQSLRGALTFCVQNASGALSRLPPEIIRRIEMIIHNTVRKDRPIRNYL